MRPRGWGRAAAARATRVVWRLREEARGPRREPGAGRGSETPWSPSFSAALGPAKPGFSRLASPVQRPRGAAADKEEEMYGRKHTHRVAALLTAVAALAFFAGSVQAANSRPAGMTKAEYRALVLRSEALNAKYGSAPGPQAGRDRLARRARPAQQGTEREVRARLRDLQAGRDRLARRARLAQQGTEREVRVLAARTSSQAHHPPSPSQRTGSCGTTSRSARPRCSASCSWRLASSQRPAASRGLASPRRHDPLPPPVWPSWPGAEAPSLLPFPQTAVSTPL